MQVLGRHEAPAPELRNLPGRDICDCPAGQPKGAKKPESFIPAHASGATVPCLSQLCDKFANEVEGDRRRPPPNRFAAAPERELVGELAARSG